MQVVAGHLRASRAAIPVVRTTFSSWLPSLSRSTTHAAYRTIAGSPATAAIRTVVATRYSVRGNLGIDQEIGLAKGIWRYAPTLPALPGITGCWWCALRLRRHGPAPLLKTLVQCLDRGQTPTGWHLDPQDPHASHSCALSGRSAVPDAACRIRSLRRSGGLPVQLGRSKGG
jgi:hypothetical protein